MFCEFVMEKLGGREEARGDACTCGLGMRNDDLGPVSRPLQTVGVVRVVD
jgi:hypothetical protein